MGFAEIVTAWKDYGVFEFYLPFVLMFAIFYGLLRRSKIFGDSKDRHATNINIVVSIVAALFVMVYTPAGVTLTVFFGTFFTQTMVILTTILCFALILYMLLPQGAMDTMFKDPSKYAKILIPLVAMIVIVVLFASGGANIFGISDLSLILPGLHLSAQDVIIAALFVIFIMVVLFIMGGESGSEKPNPIFKRE